MVCLLARPELQAPQRWALATADAHGLYEQFGFRAPAEPQIHMFIERTAAELWSSPAAPTKPGN